MILLERWVAETGPGGMLLALLAPTAVIVPAKLLGFWVMAHGHFVLGLTIILVAKMVGMSVLVRLYAVGRDKLLAIGWYRRLHDGVLHVKAWAYDHVRATAVWAASQRLFARVRALVSGGRRWAAARRLVGWKATP